MDGLGRRLGALDQRAAGRPRPESQAVREAVRRLSLAELEALEGALLAREAGLPLDDFQEGTIAAWGRVALDDAA